MSGDWTKAITPQLGLVEQYPGMTTGRMPEEGPPEMPPARRNPSLFADTYVNKFSFADIGKPLLQFKDNEKAYDAAAGFYG